MDYELVVRQAFADYAVGQEITDPREVAKILDEGRDNTHVVKRARPDRPAETARPDSAAETAAPEQTA